MSETRTKLQAELWELVAAGFPCVYVETLEHDDAQAEILGLCSAEGWQVALWDCAKGLRIPGSGQTDGDPDVLAAIRAAAQVSDGQTPGLLVMHNLHRLWAGAEVMQTLAGAIGEGKRRHAHIVILAPHAEIPQEIERQITVIGHALPDRPQLADIGRAVAEEGEYPSDGAAETQLLDAAAGLTRAEAEGAFSLSIIRHGRLEPAALWELKTAALKKSGLLELHRGAERFNDLGGLDALKEFARRALRSDRPSGLNPKGIMLLGVPGTGKSAFAKALGAETGRPTLMLDVGGLMGSLVGQTESNIRQALQIADAMAPCILFVDEIEKALAGSGAGAGDSGVARRLLGTLLTWLSDHTTDVMVVCTSNNVAELPPEFARAERFDAVYFLDLPDAEQRGRIWEIYEGHYRVSGDRPADDGWTGAEIRACCRLAALLGLPLEQAARNIVPVSQTAAESVERLRAWASGRCLDADRAGIYQRNPAAIEQPKRRISRAIGNN